MSRRPVLVLVYLGPTVYLGPPVCPQLGEPPAGYLWDTLGRLWPDDEDTDDEDSWDDWGSRYQEVWPQPTDEAERQALGLWPDDEPATDRYPADTGWQLEPDGWERPGWTHGEPDGSDYSEGVTPR